MTRSFGREEVRLKKFEVARLIGMCVRKEDGEDMEEWKGFVLFEHGCVVVLVVYALSGASVTGIEVGS